MSSLIREGSSFVEGFLTFERVCSIFSGARKFCLVHGLGHLSRDVNSDVRTLNFGSDVIFAQTRKTPNDVRKRSLCDVKCQK